jgi:hypothetical protein
MITTVEAVRRAAEKFGNPRPQVQLHPGKGMLNVAAYLDAHDITYAIKELEVGTIFVLGECIFDPSHGKGDASIIRGSDGVLRYQCFHDSCKGRTWKEARFKISGSASMSPFTEGEAINAGSKHEKTTGSHRLHFVTIRELYATVKMIEWLIKSFLDTKSLAVLFGEPGSMKTFFALDWGLCIAIAQAWHRYVVRKCGPVFYIAGEGFAGLSRRIKAWEISRGISLEDAPFFVSDRPAQILDADSAAEVVEAVDELREQHGAPVLIIIDTLNRNFGPGDENSTADMTRFVSTIDEQLRSRYQCAVLIVHHSGLSATDRARGASALRAALDWEYKLQKDAGGIRTLICTKSKDHEPPPPISFRPETITLDGWVDPDDGTVMTSCVLRRVEGAVQGKEKALTGAKKVAFDALVTAIDRSGVAGTPGTSQEGRRIVHIDLWREAAYASGISCSPTQEAKKKAFGRAINDLRAGGWIGTNNDYWWSTRDTGQGRDNAGTCPGTT